MARKRKSLIALADLGTLGYLLSKRGDKEDDKKDDKKDVKKDDKKAAVAAIAPAKAEPDDKGASTADPSSRSASADAPRVVSRPVVDTRKRVVGSPRVPAPQTDLQRARGTDDPRFRTAPPVPATLTDLQRAGGTDDPRFRPPVVRPAPQTDLQRARGTADPRFRTDPRLNSRETPAEEISDMTYKRGGSVKKASPAKGWGAARGGRSAKVY